MSRVQLAPAKLISDEIQSEFVSDETPPGVKLIEAPNMWDLGHKGKGVVIAVLDSGCDFDHPDLKGRIIGGYNFTIEGEGEHDYMDYHWHGTHVAGTIAAIENQKGVVGVAPEASLLILKVLMRQNCSPTNGSIGLTEWVTKAIRYAISWRGPSGERVKVISMSIVNESEDNTVRVMHEAIQEAVKQDILVVACAGNLGGDCGPENDEKSYPGYYSEVVSVASVGLDKAMPCRSTNSNIDLVAPGEMIISTVPGGGTQMASGCSMAVPHISGAAALLVNQFEKDFGRSPTESELYAQIIKHTCPLGNDKREEGNGLLILKGTSNCCV
ncbi:S8 family peptidase [Paenibacillus peoriae]|uniref:S8 family peptidase n=1 Tax=Paenibacillus peoriae TaxID=59893 RepID=UPI00096E9AA7|nr:S8 family peptidase [Paenibacillus peoriae]OMF31974.1 hypothetical protein BK134_12950 [Paenibacillus peoriae]